MRWLGGQAMGSADLCKRLESASWTSGMTLLVDTAAVRFVAVPPRSGALPRWTEVVLTVDTARVVLSGLLRTVNS
jgi:hypothetical protein